MKNCMLGLILVCLSLSLVGCGKDSTNNSKEKSVMVIPAGGRPVNPLQKNMPYYPWQPNMPQPWPNR
jgi:hypothetical protein